MSRYSDNAPIKNTCPMINEVISILEYPVWNLEDEDEADLAERSKLGVQIMEDIRKANETLREWGNDEHNEKESLEKERNELIDKVDDLEKEISQLKDELESLKQEV